MSVNLLDMLKDQVTGTLAKQASSFLGESEDGISKALGSGFPAILGGVISKGTSESGAKGIMDLLGNVDAGMLGNIGDIFGGGASNVNGLLNSGGGILDAILGDKLGSIVGLISKTSGLKDSSISSLLKMAEPFLMGLLKKQIAGKGISGLMNLLGDQKEHVSAALPSGMGNLLGLSGFGEGLKATASRVENTGRTAVDSAGNAVNTGMGWIKWLLPLIVIAGLAWWLMNRGNAVTETIGDAVELTTDTVKDGADAVANATQAAWSNVNEEAKEALGKLTFEANSIGRQMVDYVQGGASGNGQFRFNNLTFKTGSAEFEGESGKEVDNLAAVLKAYPDVKIHISGHTDNVGDEANNQAISEARAASVMGRLMAQDISGSRITTKGYGSTMPVGDNNTAEGRQQNRRIDVTIMK